jgi:hypothetical protein
MLWNEIEIPFVVATCFPIHTTTWQNVTLKMGTKYRKLRTTNIIREIEEEKCQLMVFF